MLPSFPYARPTTLDEALKLLAVDDARVHAGGTDLLGCLRDGVFEPSAVVSLSRIEELRQIRPTQDGGLRIGAMVPLAHVARHPDIRTRWTALAEAASRVASPQIRNQGTLGGNLCQKTRCWYYRGGFECLRRGGESCSAYAGDNRYHCILGGSGCHMVHPSDTAAALVALRASVGIAGNGADRILPVEQLYVLPKTDPTRETVLEPGEVITGILLPPPAKGVVSTYRKVRTRGSWDFALGGVAMALRRNGRRVEAARMVLSGAAPVPWRAVPAERILAGAEVDEGVAGRAAQAVLRDAEPLEHNAYKVELFRNLIVTVALELTERG